jgi:hypothetical protein
MKISRSSQLLIEVCAECTHFLSDCMYFPCICEDCKWQGCSALLELDEVESVEDDVDIFCPECKSINIGET